MAHEFLLALLLIEARSIPEWLPADDIEDFECRRSIEAPVVNWGHLRQRFSDLAKHVLEERTMRVDRPALHAQAALQLELLEHVPVILFQFPRALNQCPLGAVTASIFATCMAFTETAGLSPRAPYDRFLEDLRQQSLVELLSRDLAVLLDLAALHVTAAAEWATFPLLHIYMPELAGLRPETDVRCEGAAVAGYTAQRMLDMLQRHIPYASGRDIEGLKFLRGLDGLVSATMKDPREFSSSFVQACPAGSAAFASAAAMLSLMSNPSLFERFSNLARWILRSFTADVLMGSTTWPIFHGLAKLGRFALRSFDLVWSPSELLLLPNDPHEFDQLRAPSRRDQHLAQAEGHPNPVTRSIAAFLRKLETLRDPEAIVYVSAVGGHPFTNYIEGPPF